MQTIDYLAELNEPQRQAVMATDGPVMIVAGAGSGKTRVLTYRIAYIIQKGVDPFHILSLTFTNKAAREMRERIENVVGDEAKNLWMGTFHSVFAKILRIEAEKLGYPRTFTIYDTEDAKSLLKTIINEMQLDDKVYKPNVVYSRISNAKNNLIFPYNYGSDSERTDADTERGLSKLAEIYSTYAQRCFKAGAMDFDDLLLKTYELLNKYPEVLEKYQNKFQYLLVDEYQDTNFSQYIILKMLAAKHHNICVVGDDAQSIYAFRGATIRNILKFHEDYPEMQTYKLEQNYRSTKTIVEAAGHVISRNKDQLDKKIWTDNDSGDKIQLFRTATDTEEGRQVADNIFEERMRNRLMHADFAILYRTNAQSRSMEEALRKMNIPYRIYGGMSFYQRKEIKDLLAYLRLAVNPQDEEAFKRIINYPIRGIGKTTLEKLMVLAESEKTTIWGICEKIEYFKLGAVSTKIRDFVTMIRSFSSMLTSHSAYDVAYHVAKSSGILKELYEDRTVEGISRYENIEELLNGIKEFSELRDVNDQPLTLDLWLQDVALLTDADEDDNEKDKVSLMTIHAAKGLEFKYVYLVGLEENLFPNQMSLGSRADLEEERRLFYVAVTRARQKLTLSFADTRFRFGTLVPCEPSRFIQEIPAEYINLLTKAPRMPQRNFNLDDERGNYYNFPPKSKPAPKASPMPPRPGMSGLKPLSKINNIPVPIPAPDADFQADDTAGLMAGNKVEHQRFGFGEVSLIEGKGAERKAIVEFEKYGRKVLILKFAKLKILT